MFSDNDFLDSLIRLVLFISTIATFSVFIAMSLVLWLVALPLIYTSTCVFNRYMIFVFQCQRLFLKPIGEEDLVDEEIAELRKELEES